MGAGAGDRGIGGLQEGRNFGRSSRRATERRERMAETIMTLICAGEVMRVEVLYQLATV